MEQLRNILYFFAFAFLLLNVGKTAAVSNQKYNLTIIKSPGYPNNYKPNLNLTWLTTSSSGQPLNITFLHFDLEPENGEEEICFDKLTIEEAETGEIIFDDCGNLLPPTLTSKTNQVITTFTSDSKGQKGGFNLLMRDTNYSKSEGTINSPNYPKNYNASEKRTYIIAAPVGQNIEIEFVDLDIETHANSSCKDKLVIKELPVTLNKSYEYCGNNTPPKFVLKNDLLLLSFTSDDNIEGKGFNLNWKAIPKPEMLIRNETSVDATKTNCPATKAFPNQVIIYSSQGPCHGSILSPSEIITVASCFTQIENNTTTNVTITINPTSPNWQNVTTELQVEFDQELTAYLDLTTSLDDTIANMGIVELPKPGDKFRKATLANPWDLLAGSALYCNREGGVEWILCGIRDKEGKYIEM